MVINIPLNLWLVPMFGMMGAAWATLIATAIFAAVTFAVGQHRYRVPYAAGRIAAVFATYAAFLLAGERLASYEGGVVAKLAIVLGFMLCAAAFLGRSRMRTLWASVQRF